MRTLLALAGGAGRLEEDGSVAVLEAPELAALLARGETSGLDRARVRERHEPGAARPASLLAPGAALYGVGMNYRSKQLATGRPTPEQPVLFAKAPSSVAAGGRVALPGRAPDFVDYEGEIAVVIGQRLHGASPREAAAAICGVAAANDLTARDVMRETGNPMLAKSFPGFGQLGSALLVLDPDEIAGLELSTRLNGELRQEDSAAGMLVAPDELVALLSCHVELRPGDLVLTGTPSGTGDERAQYLRAGDVVEVCVGPLPLLRTEITAAAGPVARSAPPSQPGGN